MAPKAQKGGSRRRGDGQGGVKSHPGTSMASVSGYVSRKTKSANHLTVNIIVTAMTIAKLIFVILSALLLEIDPLRSDPSSLYQAPSMFYGFGLGCGLKENDPRPMRIVRFKRHEADKYHQ